MTSPADQQKLQLAVAKATLSATLSGGGVKAPSQLVTTLQNLLNEVTARPTQKNVKEARIWIIETCQTEKQISAVTRLLSAMAPTLQTFKERLALLYVLNDVLYHATNTFRQSKSFIPSATVQYLTPLLNSVKSASSARSEPIDKLLRLWSEEKYFTDEEYAQVTGLPPKTGVSTGKAEVEQKQLVKPAMLGVPGDPHWLLPVSCMLDYSADYTPVPASSVKAIKLSSRTDPDLMKRVETFESSIHEWKFIEDEDSEGELFDGEGWNMKFWRDRLENGSREGRMRAWSSSPSRSPSPARKRDRAYSRSPPGRRRSRSDSRSASPRRSSPPLYGSRSEYGGGGHGRGPMAPQQSLEHNQVQSQYQYPPAPASSGYFRMDAGSQNTQAQPSRQGPSQQYGRNVRDEYGDRNRSWR